MYATSTSNAAAERRRARRLPCEIDLVDRANRVYRAENIDVRGIKYTGSIEPPQGEHAISLRLPVSGFEINVIAKPVWVRRRGVASWEIGALLQAEEEQRLRLEFLVNALDEHLELHDLRFVSLGLLRRSEELLPEVQMIARTPVPALIERSAAKVASVSARPRFYWQYACHLIPRFALTSVDDSLVAEVTRLKHIAAVLFTVLDDIADERRDPELFRRVIVEVLSDGRLRSGALPEHDAVVRHLRALWRLLRVAVQCLPRGPELRELFDFDVRTLAHGMSHSLVGAHLPEAISEDEQRQWTVASAFAVLFGDLDLMASPGLDSAELPEIREVIMQAQEMCAIANWIGTWERELRSGDHSSGFFGMALRKGVVSAAELRALDPRDSTSLGGMLLKLRASDVEASLLARWERGWRRLDARRDTVHTFDVGAYLEANERFLQLQLASRGRL